VQWHTESKISEYSYVLKSIKLSTKGAMSFFFDYYMIVFPLGAALGFDPSA
jgi:hypothetical protein